MIVWCSVKVIENAIRRVNTAVIQEFRLESRGWAYVPENPDQG